jgi:alanyl-tRNA synthetase
MTGTLRLYYTEPFLLETEALALEVRESGGRTYVVLDRTPFYPEGGGQPCDLGDIAGMRLEQVTEKDDSILHWIAGKTEIKAGDTVICKVDGARRRYHTQQHSGQHLLSAVLEREYSFHTVGFHLGENYCTIDITAPEFGRETVQRVEELVDERIVRSLPLKVHVCPPEDPSVFPLRKKLPEGEESLRIVEIDNYDWVPCCGTHVSDTSELRAVKILSSEKYKGATRLYFVSGDHAVRVLAQRFSLLAAAASIVGCSQEDIPSRLGLQKSRLDWLESERMELLKARANLELSAMKDECDLLAIVFSSRKSDAVQESVKAALTQGLSVIAVSISDKTVIAAIPSASQSHDSVNLGAMLKPLLAVHGGSGGGGPGNFRAAFKDEDSCLNFYEAALSAMGGKAARLSRIEL